jgi:hypothetical protein
MFLWNLVCFKYHEWLSSLVRIEGAFQTSRFIHHRNKAHYYQRKLNKGA